jgi:ATP-binding cassette subfamily F protein uup
MSTLIARDIEKAFGDRQILRGASLAVAPGERVGLVGANGSGKSTLLRVLSGAVEPDHGQVQRDGRLGLLDQEPVFEGATVAEAMAAVTAWHKALLEDYQAALDAGELAGAAAIQDELDRVGWSVDHQVDAILDKLGAPPKDARLSSLSGGERRRVALARALLGGADMLLLDEPTNHLDVDAAEWLQAYLNGHRGAVVLVTHDRYLLEAVATRIVEVDDGLCVSYDGSYGDYLLARAERQASLERAEDSRLAMLAREAAWAARSPAARTTKQRARLKRLEDLQEARPLARQSAFALDLRCGLKKGMTVLELHGLAKSYGERLLFRDVTVTLSPGDRLAVLGPNGAGKSTLLRVLLGEEAADRGEIIRGPRIRAAVLDQHRSGLDPEDTVFDAAGGGNSHVRLGDRDVHVASFLGRFLFPRQMLDQRVEALSGGERARLLLARLLLQGANLLVLDEPTNDLDLLTLRVLEEALLSYDGAAVLVSHDRALVDRVCNKVLAFEPGGVVTVYASRLQALKAARDREAEAAAAREAAQAEAAAKEAARTTSQPTPARSSSRGRLSYKEKKELEALPGRIEALEAEREAAAETLGDPETYRSRADEVPALTAKLQQLDDEIAAAYERWDALESAGG